MSSIPPATSSGTDLVGNDVEVLFGAGERRKWYRGTVVGYIEETRRHNVAFEDGEVHDIDLEAMSLELEDEQGQPHYQVRLASRSGWRGWVRVQARSRLCFAGPARPGISFI